MPRFEDVFIVRQDKSKPHPAWGIYNTQKKQFVLRDRWRTEEQCRKALSRAIAIVRQRRWLQRYEDIQARLDAWEAIVNEPCSYDDCQEIEP
jgi:hypothetical protein